MSTSGQTINDRINAARYALAGQGLARCVCKATTEEVIAPKKKHLDFLIACTHQPNVSVPQLANLLIERTQHTCWVVVFKALVTIHHLMSYGNERYAQYLASSNYSFELSSFLDKTAVRDISMSTYIRRYSIYINEKAASYRLLALDLCKVKRGNDGLLRLMPIDRLLKTLTVLQNQLDALLEFDCNVDDLNNGVINACFMLLFRDLIGLFACHNDGIINLLDKYFTLNKKLCREAFELYKKFLVRMDKVSDFLRVAELVGLDKDEIPDLRRPPGSLVEALEQYLQNVEVTKKTKKLPQSSQNDQSSASDTNTASNLNPFATSSSSSSSPFFLPPPETTNGTSVVSALDSANDPFLDTANDFAASDPIASAFGSTIALKPEKLAPSAQTEFKPVPPKANYTSLGVFDSQDNNLTLFSKFDGKQSNNLTGETGILDGFGDLLQPTSTSTSKSAVTSNNNNNNNKQAFSNTTGMPSTGLFKGDLDSTLASLAQNLTL